MSESTMLRGLLENAAGRLANNELWGSKTKCWAEFGQFRDEGLELIGPMESADASTHWHITITWTPVPS